MCRGHKRDCPRNDPEVFTGINPAVAGLPCTCGAWARGEAEVWNRDHPVGTKVIVTRDDGTEFESKTRSKAWALGDHTAVVKVKGITGGYRLDRVRPGKERHR